MDEMPPTSQPDSPDRPDPGLDDLYRAAVKTPVGMLEFQGVSD